MRKTSLRNQIVWDIRYDSIKRRRLSEQDLSFNKAVELAISLETAMKDVEELAARSTSSQRPLNYVKVKQDYNRNGKIPSDKFQTEDQNKARSLRVETMVYADHLRNSMLESGTEALLGQKLGTNDSVERVLLPLVKDNSKQKVSQGQTNEPSLEKPPLSFPSASDLPWSSTPLAVSTASYYPFGLYALSTNYANGLEIGKVELEEVNPHLCGGTVENHFRENHLQFTQPRFEPRSPHPWRSSSTRLISYVVSSYSLSRPKRRLAVYSSPFGKLASSLHIKPRTHWMIIARYTPTADVSRVSGCTETSPECPAPQQHQKRCRSIANAMRTDEMRLSTRCGRTTSVETCVRIQVDLSAGDRALCAEHFLQHYRKVDDSVLNHSTSVRMLAKSSASSCQSVPSGSNLNLAIGLEFVMWPRACFALSRNLESIILTYNSKPEVLSKVDCVEGHIIGRWDQWPHVGGKGGFACPEQGPRP
uniref:Uncharacterized protein n=1 Tax=Timema shepardi TaxID=629360 RepID=A0A7R9FWZ0_TIMSH|nr:unnamed protein product [Timema shepardi]